MAIDIGKVDFSSAQVVGTKNLGNSQLTNFTAGNNGELIVAEWWGKYAELVRQGFVYVARVNTAASVPVNSALTNAPALWNPSGSGKWVMPLKIMLSVGAIGTPVLQGFTLSYLNNAGATAATAAPVLTFTTQAVVNMQLGQGASSKALFAPAVATYTTNPAILMDLGIGHFLEGTAATGQLYTLMHDFDGELLIPPGSLISFGSTIASSTTYYTTIIYAEFPALVS
jgi:hypothetical protein